MKRTSNLILVFAFCLGGISLHSGYSQTGMNANFHQELINYQVTAMTAVGDTAFFASADILISADISDPENVVYLDSILIGNGMTQPSGLVVEGKYLYLVTNRDGLHIYDVGNPSQMVFVDTLGNISARWLSNIYSWSNLLFITDDINVFIYTINQKENPTYKSQFEAYTTELFSIILGPGISMIDTWAYFESRRDLNIGFIHDSGTVSNVETIPSVETGVSRFVFKDSYFYACSGHRLFTYIMVSEREFMLLDVDEAEIEICSLQIVDDVLYAISAGAGHLFCFDISDRTDPVLIAEWGNSRITPFRNMIIRGDYVFIGTEVSPGLFTVKTSLPSVSTDRIAAPSSLSLTPAYPNPVASGSAATVEFALPASGHVTLTLCNTLGQELRRIEKRLEPGTHSERISTTGLNPGVYYYTLTAEGKRETEMLVVR